MLRKRLLPECALQNDPNLLVMPNIESANIAYNLLKTAAGGNIAIGPVLQGLRKPVNDLSRGATVRDIVNTVAITAIQAQGGSSVPSDVQ